MKKYGIVINNSKSIFGASEVTFLGYRISASDTKPLEAKVQAIKDFLVPKDVRQLRRLLGIANFYRRVSPQAALIQEHLNSPILQSYPRVWRITKGFQTM